MEEMIQLVRRQLVLCLRLLDLLGLQKKALLHTESQNVPRITKDIEVVIIELNRLEKHRSAILQTAQVKDARAWLDKQPAGKEKDLLRQLLEKQGSTLQKLKEASSSNTQYLNKNMKYIDYNINVMTGAVAGVTYGLPDAADTGTTRSVKMFEANI